MPHPVRTIAMTGAAATVTSDTTYAHIVVPEWASGAIVRVEVGTVTGTSPTLNVYIQAGQRDLGTETIGQDLQDPDTFNFFDVISFTQITASSTVRIASVLGSGEEEFASTAGTLTAGQIRNGPINGLPWRVFADVGGTNPSFAAFQVVATFVP